MKLGIVGTGAMGEILKSCAEQDDFFDEIYMIEPAGENPWPQIKLDLIIDFSHPQAIYQIYDYCREKGGNIPVVIGTTGYQSPEEKILTMLRKICPVEKKTNFSEGIKVMCELSETAKKCWMDVQTSMLQKSTIRRKKTHPAEQPKRYATI